MVFTVKWNIVLFYLAANFCCLAEIRLSLNSDDVEKFWIVRNQDNRFNITAKVPGGVYTDLQSAGLLDDELFYRFNDINYRWVANEDWIYTLQFDLPSQAVQKRNVNLVFHGVDTIANISLNGNFLSRVNNMFVRHVISVKDVVKEKGNVLEVRFTSPIREANFLSEVQRKSYPIPPECTPETYNGECHVNFLRKMQASFSWDWGPAFPSMGFWKPVEIEAFDTVVLRDITLTENRVSSGYWILSVDYYVEFAEGVSPKPDLNLGFSIRDSSTGTPINFRILPGDRNKDELTKNGYIYKARVYVAKEDIGLWWPNGLGDQVLYNMTFNVTMEGCAEYSRKSILFGFRTIELIQRPLDAEKKGLTFYFRVNGVPFFAKGSNWIPGHILPELGYNETYIRYMLQSAKDANMNMIRVWGGGVYESDIFYEIADKMGILIWQDMMFACSMYPADKSFLDSVNLEVQQQVRRLQYHPSIAIWAGNNENEVALRGNWYKTDANFSLYQQDYIKLYVDTIKVAVEKIDNTRLYVTSSPSNGLQSEEENYIAENPYSPLYGDVHYYNYVMNGWSSNIYPDTRFASEYGFQSMPSFQSLSKVTIPSDRIWISEFMRKRQHLPDGNQFLINMIEQHFSLPINDGSEQYFKKLIYYSQITQAMSTKTETEKYRRNRSKLTSDNKGYTMGAMYWQLNDVWQAPSWSSIEFGGKWKMLQYYAKKFFNTVLVSPEWVTNDIIDVYLVSDRLTDIPNILLTTYVYSWDSFTPKKVYSQRVTLRNSTSAIYASYRLKKLLLDSNCQKQTCFLFFAAVGPDFSTDNVLFLSKIRNIKNLRPPTLTVSVEETPHRNKAIVKVTTDAITPFVWLETEEIGEFSDNGFILLTPDMTFTFQNLYDQPIDFEKLKSTIEIRSIY